MPSSGASVTTSFAESTTKKSSPPPPINSSTPPLPSSTFAAALPVITFGSSLPVPDTAVPSSVSFSSLSPSTQDSSDFSVSLPCPGSSSTSSPLSLMRYVSLPAPPAKKSGPAVPSKTLSPSLSSIVPSALVVL